MKTTLLITTFNRAGLLVSSLDRLRKLSLPDEIIIVDDGSTDGTQRCVAAARSQFGLPIRYIYNHNPGPTICSLARNIGVKEASHDLIITSEPELRFLTDVVRQFKTLHEARPDEVISSGVVFFQPEGGYVPTYERPRGWQEARGWVAPHTALYSREWLYQIGGWDESFPGSWGWDDTDLLTRLRIAGHGQYIAPDVEAVHQWHPLGGDPGGQNEQHFLAKSFNRDEQDISDLVANQGREWGKVRLSVEERNSA